MSDKSLDPGLVAATGEEPAIDQKQIATRTPKPSKALPSNRVGFIKQLELLRAWAIASKGGTVPATNGAVAEMIGMHGGTTTTCNAFFFDVGFLRRGDGGIYPGLEVVEYQRAIEWNPDGGSEKLAPALERSWFGQALLPRLGLRAMPKRDAMSVLADASSASKEYRAQIGLLFQYLEAAGLITIDGDMVERGKLGQPRHEEHHDQAPPKDSAKHGATVEDHRDQKPPAVPPSVPGDGLSFDVSVRVSLAEMSGWAPERIQAFFQGVAAVLAAKGGLEKKGA